MRALDLTNKRFGRLIVLSLAAPFYTSKGVAHRQYICQCDCGKQITIKVANLQTGTKSCGCYRKEVTRQRMHKHGLSHTTIYYVWSAMRARCLTPTNADYYLYGARGITVCDRWKSFENFYADMGDCPKGLTLERIENDKGYEPDNCKWATLVEQRHNQRPRKRGYVHSDITKHKISVALTGKPKSTEHKNKLRIAALQHK